MEHAVLNGFLRTAEFKGFFPQQDIETSPDRQHPRGSGKHLLACDEKAHAGGFDSGDEGPGGPTVTENDGRVFITLICLFSRLTQHAIRWLTGI
jgi:hypothetical protein